MPNVSQDTKDKIAYRIAFSSYALISAMVISHYWFLLYIGRKPIFSEIIILLISIPTTAYFIYCLIKLFKLVFFIIHKVFNIILPAGASLRNIIIYTIQSLTSLFIAVSSLIAAFWGIITALKPFFEQ